MDRSVDEGDRDALSAPPHLAVRGLRKRYDGREVVRGIDLAIARGEFLCLLGPSGCGKTTTLNLIAGFVSPDAGTIDVDGSPVQHLPPHRRNMGMVFQNYALFPHLSVFENVAFALRLRKLARTDIENKVRHALALTHLEGFESRFPRQLSGGQQQRVALARALVFEPTVLLLDEPFSNLDAKLRRQMRDEVREIQRRVGITTIFVTHDQEEALAISDRVAVLCEGRIEDVGTPLRVYRQPRSSFVAGFVGEVNVIPSGGGTALYLRPEALRVRRGCVPPSPHALAGTVEATTFLGARRRYAIRCEPLAASIVIESPASGEETLASGDRVIVEWEPADAILLRDG
jgi:ABC-type Fe3+/spermidine/putrescine transport system ATPase subunit